MSESWTIQEALQIGSYLISIGAIIFQAGALRQRVNTLENQFKAFMEHCATCKSGLDKEDNDLHTRVTALVDRTARMEGHLNGQKKRAGHG